MQLEINNPRMVSILQHLAERSHRSVSQVAEEILEEHLPRSERVLSILAELKKGQEEQRMRRGGVPFSDSTEIIRESRDNDH